MSKYQPDQDSDPIMFMQHMDDYEDLLKVPLKKQTRRTFFSAFFLFSLSLLWRYVNFQSGHSTRQHAFFFPFSFISCSDIIENPKMRVIAKFQTSRMQLSIRWMGTEDTYANNPSVPYVCSKLYTTNRQINDHDFFSHSQILNHQPRTIICHN